VAAITTFFHFLNVCAILQKENVSIAIMDYYYAASILVILVIISVLLKNVVAKV